MMFYRLRMQSTCPFFHKLSILLDYVDVIFILVCNFLYTFPNWPEEQIQLFYHI